MPTFTMSGVVNPSTGYQPLRVAIVGTSLMQQNTYATSLGAIGCFTRSWIDWASFFGNGACEIFDVSDKTDYPGWSDRKFIGTNFGVSGQTCDEILARIPNIIANKALYEIIIVDMGTNDMLSLTKEVIHAKRIEAVEQLVASGAKVVLLTILARDITSWPSGSAQRKKANWINQKTHTYFKNATNVIVHDWNMDWVDVNNADGIPVAAYSDDGIHFATRGGYRVGRGLWDRTLSKLLPIGNSLVTSPDDKFDATDNPYGLLNSNPFFTGTSGTAGTGVTGTVPTGMTVERTSGSTCTAVASIVSKGAHGGNAVRMTFTLGGTADEIFSVRVTGSDTAHTLAGKWVQPSVTVSTSTAADTIKAIKLVLIDQSNTSNRSETFKEIGTFYYPAEAISEGQIIGRPLKLGAGSTSHRISVEVHVNGSGSVAPVVDISKFGVRQIDVPQMYRPDGTLFTG